MKREKRRAGVYLLPKIIANRNQLSIDDYGEYLNPCRDRRPRLSTKTIAHRKQSARDLSLRRPTLVILEGREESRGATPLEDDTGGGRK